MALPIPEEIEQIALFLFDLGYRYSESYPWRKWQERGWPNDPLFIKLVDGCLKILWTMKEVGPGKRWVTSGSIPSGRF